MLRKLKELLKVGVQGRDGAIGHLKDIYFEDEHWNIRYFVIDVGTWMHSNAVLLSPAALNKAAPSSATDLVFELSKEEIRNSPPVDTAKPVSRQHEADLYRYYGWTPYWTGFSPAGLDAMGTALAVENLVAAIPIAGREPLSDSSPVADEASGDPHLRSLNQIIHYKIVAIDGSSGHLEDVLVDGQSWKVPYLLVNTNDWWPGRRVVVPTKRVTEVSWARSEIRLSLVRDVIKCGPSLDSSTPLDEEHMLDVSGFYGG